MEDNFGVGVGVAFSEQPAVLRVKTAADIMARHKPIKRKYFFPAVIVYSSFNKFIIISEINNDEALIHSNFRFNLHTIIYHNVEFTPIILFNTCRSLRYYRDHDCHAGYT